MTREISTGGKTIRYELERKSVKNINLRIKPDGSIFVSASKTVSIQTVENFIKSKSDFILRALEKCELIRAAAPSPLLLENGEQIAVFGKKLTLSVEKSNKNLAAASEGLLLLFVTDVHDTELKRKTLRRFLDDICREKISQLCGDIYSYFKPLGVDFPQIKFRKMKSRWGSCNPSKGILTFNLALVHAPVPAVEYVVLHEFNHFLHHDHSKRFYDSLEKIMPDYKARRNVLKFCRTDF
ncbi:MAG: M48 family metallopeptidase [Acutalibacteraceae bacterium]